MAQGQFDPTHGFTDLQWYMYHQHNVAFFASFSTSPFTQADLVSVARELMILAPQIAGRVSAPAAISDETPKAITHLETVNDFSSFPDSFFNDGADILARPHLPLFRISAANRQHGADAEGRAGFIFVQVSHAVAEGADSALLSRSRTTERYKPLHLPVGRKLPSQSTNSFGAVAGKLLGGPAAFGHLLASRFGELRPGPFGYRSLVADRKEIVALAKHMHVRQRALFYALGLIGLFGQSAIAQKRRITTTYSAIDNRAEAASGGFMRMRMLFAAFSGASTLDDLARNVDEDLAQAEAKESGFNLALNASALSAHRKLHKIFPALYRRQVFTFMPYDAVLGLLPPHRLDGGLTKNLVEPVFAGAALDGANACVMVPGREKISFNFYCQTRLHHNVDELSALLESRTGSTE